MKDAKSRQRQKTHKARRKPVVMRQQREYSDSLKRALAHRLNLFGLKFT